MHYDFYFAHKKQEHREMNAFTQGQTGDMGHSWELGKSLPNCSPASLT